ncbi:arginine-glutamic acid dipeptide repeats protein-like [Saccopteryx leptura]|uniref:arginine-glutamic acid dipeptide repeats protein-like n=1 Tax=Saccopteryx leptura TaxID=249018 RepID=UPI00339C4DC0
MRQSRRCWCDRRPHDGVKVCDAPKLHAEKVELDGRSSPHSARAPRGTAGHTSGPAPTVVSRTIGGAPDSERSITPASQPQAQGPEPGEEQAVGLGLGMRALDFNQRLSKSVVTQRPGVGREVCSEASRQARWIGTPGEGGPAAWVSTALQGCQLLPSLVTSSNVRNTVGSARLVGCPPRYKSGMKIYCQPSLRPPAGGQSPCRSHPSLAMAKGAQRIFQQDSKRLGCRQSPSLGRGRSWSQHGGSGPPSRIVADPLTVTEPSGRRKRPLPSGPIGTSISRGLSAAGFLAWVIKMDRGQAPLECHGHCFWRVHIPCPWGPQWLGIRAHEEPGPLRYVQTQDPAASKHTLLPKVPVERRPQNNRCRLRSRISGLAAGVRGVHEQAAEAEAQERPLGPLGGQDGKTEGRNLPKAPEPEKGVEPDGPHSTINESNDSAASWPAPQPAQAELVIRSTGPPIPGELGGQQDCKPTDWAALTDRKACTGLSCGPPVTPAGLERSAPLQVSPGLRPLSTPASLPWPASPQHPRKSPLACVPSAPLQVSPGLRPRPLSTPASLPWPASPSPQHPCKSPLACVPIPSAPLQVSPGLRPRPLSTPASLPWPASPSPHHPCKSALACVPVPSSPLQVSPGLRPRPLSTPASLPRPASPQHPCKSPPACVPSAPLQVCPGLRPRPLSTPASLPWPASPSPQHPCKSPLACVPSAPLQVSPGLRPLSTPASLPWPASLSTPASLPWPASPQHPRKSPLACVPVPSAPLQVSPGLRPLSTPASLPWPASPSPQHPRKSPLACVPVPSAPLQVSPGLLNRRNRAPGAKRLLSQDRPLPAGP